MSNTIRTKETLSFPAKLLYWLAFPSTLAILSTVSPQTALCLPILCLPAILMLRGQSRLPRNQRSNLETLIWIFFASGTAGVMIVVAIQSGLSYGAAFMLFGSQTQDYLEEFGRTSSESLGTEDKQRRLKMVWTWQYFTFLLLLAFIMMGLIEEVLKFAVVALIRCRREKLAERDYISYIIAASLGFSTLENIGYVYASAQKDAVAMLALTVAERVILSVTGHALMGVLTAMNMIRGDVRGERLRIWRILGPAVLYHGCFDFAVFTVSAADGNVGWVHPTEPRSLFLLFTLAVGMWVVLVFHVRSSLRRLKLHT